MMPPPSTYAAVIEHGGLAGAGARTGVSKRRASAGPPVCTTVQGTAAARLRTLHVNRWPAANGTPQAEKGCSTVMPAYVSPPAVASWISPPGRMRRTKGWP